MSKEKLAIISTYGVVCGIAYNAERVYNQAKNYFDTDIITVDSNLLRRAFDRNLKKAAKKHIKDIVLRIKDYKYINLQLEIGIFGYLVVQAIPRFLKILRSLKKDQSLLINLHTVIKAESFLSKFRNSMNKSKIRKVTSLIYTIYNNYYINKFWSELYNLSKKRTINLVVYNPRDYDYLTKVIGFNNVHLYPLCYFFEKEISKYKENKEQFLSRFGIKKGEVAIAIFGFIASYKGFIDALNANSLLPSNYKLIIFGGNNINNIKDPLNEDFQYSMSLIKFVETQKLEERVIFAGTLSDEEMPYAFAAIDLAILPYKTSQAASGPASLAIELSDRIIMTDIDMFKEYYNYYKSPNIRLYQPGNHIELSKLIIELCSKPYVNERKGTFSAEGQINLYQNILKNNEKESCNC